MADDNRCTPRLEMLGYVPGEMTVMVPIAIRDLSTKGLMVESSFPLLLNSVHDLRLHLGEDSLVVKGRVAHCRVADLGTDVTVYRAGIEFIDPPERVIRAIETHLAQITQQRQGN